jgi:hypothetical protein
VGAAGVAVLADVVVMAGGVEARFVAMNENGPPKAPAVVFCKVNVAGFGALVKVQMILAKGFKFVAGMVMTLPAKVPKLAGFSVVAEFVSVHVPLDRLKLLLAASVSVTGFVTLVIET